MLYQQRAVWTNLPEWLFPSHTVVWFQKTACICTSIQRGSKGWVTVQTSTSLVLFFLESVFKAKRKRKREERGEKGKWLNSHRPESPSCMVPERHLLQTCSAPGVRNITRSDKTSYPLHWAYGKETHSWVVGWSCLMIPTLCLVLFTSSTSCLFWPIPTRSKR